MSPFKLIAIVPLAHCSTDYRKNLIIGEPYQFYSDYKIELSTGKKEISTVKKKKKNPVPENLYELENGISLSFSAVVGKNGTGKSTLFELFSYFIYVLSIHKEIDNRRVLLSQYHEINLQRDKAKIDYVLLEQALKDKSGYVNTPSGEKISTLAHALRCRDAYRLYVPESKIKDELSFEQNILEELQKSIGWLLHSSSAEKEWHSKLFEGLNVSIIYETEHQIREAAYYSGTFHFSVFTPDKAPFSSSIDSFDLKSLFYSVSVNFSHHGLNANSIGGWINKLFHKNDAYTTPLVINPMRDDGNFDINHELNLSKERLLANLLYDLVSKRESLLLEKYSVMEFIFTPKNVSNIFAYPFDGDADRIAALQSITVLKNVLSKKNLSLGLPYWDYALTYLEKKIGKIKEKYGFLIYKEVVGQSREAQFDAFLLNDKTHVTKKIRQVINFLTASAEKSNQQFWKQPAGSGDTSISFEPEIMHDWLKRSHPALGGLMPSELIEYGLPGFFNIDLMLNKNGGEPIAFSKLSSGEQQLILNSNGLLYHLSNINSVHTAQKDPNGISRIAYENVNIILDEVELYYHPEMQRNLVSDLIKTFERVRLKGAAGIQGINVCILTHSPFILSDIPSQNVLNLTDDKDKEMLSAQTQTFGANIHEMLIGKFFMESTTGEHVRTLTAEMLGLYSKISLARSGKELAELKKTFESGKEKFSFLVNNIGEEVVSSILKNHLEYMKEVFKN